MGKTKQISLAFIYGMMAWETAMRLKNVGEEVMWKHSLPKRLVTSADKKKVDKALSYVTEFAPDPHPQNATDFWATYADIITPRYQKVD